MCQVREPVLGNHQLYTNSITPQSEILALSFFSNIHRSQEMNLFDWVWFLGEGLWLHGKESLPIQETQVRSLGWVDSLEEETATHSSILAKKVPWTEEPDGLQSMGPQSMVGHDRAHLGVLVLVLLGFFPPHPHVQKRRTCQRVGASRPQASPAGCPLGTRECER